MIKHEDLQRAIEDADPEPLWRALITYLQQLLDVAESERAHDGTTVAGVHRTRYHAFLDIHTELEELVREHIPPEYEPLLRHVYVRMQAGERK